MSASPAPRLHYLIAVSSSLHTNSTIVQDLVSAMEVGNLGPSNASTGVSSGGDIQTTKGNKRKNHRGGRKKKGKMGPKVGNQNTSAEDTDFGALKRDGDSIVCADAGDKLTASQDFRSYCPSYR